MAKEYFTVPHWPGTKPAGIEGISRHMSSKAALELEAGKKMGEDLLAGEVVALNPEWGTQLTDFLKNSDNLLVVSERARALFVDQGLGPDEVEFIPFQLKDKKGKLLSKKYAIANPLRHVAALDPKRSNCELFTNPVSGKQKWFVSSIELDLSKVPDDARLFHLGENPYFILIRSDLLEAIRKAKLTGLVEQELGKPL